MKISDNLDYNVKAVKAITGSDDVICFEFLIGDLNAVAVYVDSITDKETMGIELIAPLRRANPEISVKKLAKSVNLANIEIKQTVNESVTDILAGKTVVFFDGKQSAISADLKKFEVRKTMIIVCGIYLIISALIPVYRIDETFAPTGMKSNPLINGSIMCLGLKRNYVNVYGVNITNIVNLFE